MEERRESRPMSLRHSRETMLALMALCLVFLFSSDACSGTSVQRVAGVDPYIEYAVQRATQTYATSLPIPDAHNAVTTESLGIEAGSSVTSRPFSIPPQRQQRQQQQQQRQRNSIFRPIRIRVDVSSLYNPNMVCTRVGQVVGDGLSNNVTCSAADILTEAKRDYLTALVIPDVLARVRRLFEVRGRVGNHSKPARLFVPQGACGPLVPIPFSHTRDGLMDTDLVLYALSVPVLDDPSRDGSSSSLPARRGRTLTSSAPRSTTIAWSGYCSLSSEDDGRPTVARVNFAPSQTYPIPAAAASSVLSSSSSSLLATSSLLLSAREARIETSVPSIANGAVEQSWRDRYVRAVLHEVFHCMGFAPAFFSDLRAVSDSLSSSSVSIPKSSSPRSSAFVEKKGDRIVALKAPAIVEAARRMLDCPSITRVLMEDEGGEGTESAHWERRLFRDDIMSGVPSSVSAVSALTLAFFSSLPFYRVHTEYAEPVRWGNKAGCDFALGNCSSALQSGTSLSFPAGGEVALDETEAKVRLVRRQYWCSVSHEEGSSLKTAAQCSYDRRSIGICNIRYATTVDGEERPYGASLLMNGCPVVEPYRNMACTNPLAASDDTGRDKVPELEAQGNWLGPQSRCVRSSHMKRVKSPQTTTWEQLEAEEQNGKGGVDIAASSKEDKENEEEAIGSDMDVTVDSVVSQRRSSDIANSASAINRLITGDSNSQELPLALQLGDSEDDTIIQRHYADNNGQQEEEEEEAILRAQGAMTEAKCLRMRCVDGVRVEVNVGGEWLACPRDGSTGLLQIPRSTGFKGTIACDPAALVCTPELFYVEAEKAAEEMELADDLAASSHQVRREFVVKVAMWVAPSRSNASLTSSFPTLVNVVGHCAGDLQAAVQMDLSDALGTQLGAGTWRSKNSSRVVPPFAAAALAVRIPSSSSNGLSNSDNKNAANVIVPALALYVSLAVTAESADAARQVATEHIHFLDTGTCLPRVGSLMSVHHRMPRSGTINSCSNWGQPTLLSGPLMASELAAMPSGCSDSARLWANAVVQTDGVVYDGPLNPTDVLAVADVQLLCVLRMPPSSPSSLSSLLARSISMVVNQQNALLAVRGDVAMILGLSPVLVAVHTMRSVPELRSEVEFHSSRIPPTEVSGKEKRKRKSKIKNKNDDEVGDESFFIPASAAASSSNATEMFFAVDMTLFLPSLLLAADPLDPLVYQRGKKSRKHSDALAEERAGVAQGLQKLSRRMWSKALLDAAVAGLSMSETASITHIVATAAEDGGEGSPLAASFSTEAATAASGWSVHIIASRVTKAVPHSPGEGISTTAPMFDPHEGGASAPPGGPEDTLAYNGNGFCIAFWGFFPHWRRQQCVSWALTLYTLGSVTALIVIGFVMLCFYRKRGLRWSAAA